MKIQKFLDEMTDLIFKSKLQGNKHLETIQEVLKRFEKCLSVDEHKRWSSEITKFYYLNSTQLSLESFNFRNSKSK